MDYPMNHAPHRVQCQNTLMHTFDAPLRADFEFRNQSITDVPCPRITEEEWNQPLGDYEGAEDARTIQRHIRGHNDDTIRYFAKLDTKHYWDRVHGRVAHVKPARYTDLISRLFLAEYHRRLVTRTSPDFVDFHPSAEESHWQCALYQVSELDLHANRDWLDRVCTSRMVDEEVYRRDRARSMPTERKARIMRRLLRKQLRENAVFERDMDAFGAPSECWADVARGQMRQQERLMKALGLSAQQVDDHIATAIDREMLAVAHLHDDDEWQPRASYESAQLQDVDGSIMEATAARWGRHY